MLILAMLKKTTLLSVITLAGLFSQPVLGQSSFDPLEYTAQNIENVTESAELSSCEKAKAYIEGYFKKVRAFNNELQSGLAFQGMSLTLWSESVASRADNKIYYKKNSFKALSDLGADLSQFIAVLEESSYVLSEDGFLILDNVLPECFPDASDKLYEAFEGLVTDRLDLADIYNEYLNFLVGKIYSLYSSVALLETEKEYFGEDNLMKFNELADVEYGFSYGVGLYGEIVESYNLKEDKILEEL